MPKYTLMMRYKRADDFLWKCKFKANGDQAAIDKAYEMVKAMDVADAGYTLVAKEKMTEFWNTGRAIEYFGKYPTLKMD